MIERIARALGDREKIAREIARGNMVDGVTILHTATVLWNGWELDDKMWIVADPIGVFGITTSHSAGYVMSTSELDEAINRHREALAGNPQPKRNGSASARLSNRRRMSFFFNAHWGATLWQRRFSAQ